MTEAKSVSHCDTSGKVRREAIDEAICLAVVSRGNKLPEVQNQSNRYAAGAAKQIQASEEWVAVLERGNARLRGEASRLHCTFTIEDVRPSTEECVIETSSSGELHTSNFR